VAACLRQNRTPLCEEWAGRIAGARVLSAMSPEELRSETGAIYDSSVEVLETGSMEVLQAQIWDLSERITRQGAETHEVLDLVLLLRDVLARAICESCQDDFNLLNQTLDAYETVANRMLKAVGMSFAQGREHLIHEQRQAIRELSTPVLPLREGLLILPMIGAIDSRRARQLTEELLRGIRHHRAKVVVVDITGVPAIDSTAANHLVQTMEASRLMGATIIFTGLSAEIAKTLVAIGVELSKLNAVGDLRGGIEEAERLLAARPRRSVEAISAGSNGQKSRGKMNRGPLGASLPCARTGHL